MPDGSEPRTSQPAPEPKDRDDKAKKEPTEQVVSKEMHTTEPAKEEAAERAGDDKEHPVTHKPKGRPIWLYAIVALLIIAPIVGILVLTHIRHKRDQKSAQRAQAEQDKGPQVLVTHATMTPPKRSISLPADTRAVLATTLYAKTSGYIVEMKTDKGFHVKQGEVLAILQSPEVDQQVAEAKADLDVKERNTIRNDELAKNGIVSEQVRDQAAGDFRTAVANLKQKQTLSGYEIIRAPFDGIVTARYVDPGALVPAATGSTESAMPVVDVAKIDTLRAVVYLGQDVASFIQEKNDVTLWQDEYPTVRWGAQITRLAGNLDPRTRTELAEIWFDNREHQIPPGVYLHAEIDLKVPPSPVVSNEALITRGGKTFVAAIQNDTAHLMPITPGYSDGRNTMVLTGMKGDEVVGMNVPPEIVEGSKVRTVEAPKQPAPEL